MNWKGPKPIAPQEEWRDCFAWVPRRIAQYDDGSWLWIWLQRYQERLVESRCIPGGGSAFEFERSTVLRQHGLLIGTLTRYCD